MRLPGESGVVDGRLGDSYKTKGQDGIAENAFDGNPYTIWRTEWSGGEPPHPHETQIDLGGNYTIGGFRNLPRQSTTINGTIAACECYVSADGTNWGTAVAELNVLGLAAAAN